MARFVKSSPRRTRSPTAVDNSGLRSANTGACAERRCCKLAAHAATAPDRLAEKQSLFT
ncbi:hypothetical protein [Dactylosporangium sp. CA-233914]|uniref:hypothetical protein n=1 Tax=Dactylosporangium sp. CA-233914 TaxID=3239934 RepID=UPI003D8EE7BC